MKVLLIPSAVLMPREMRKKFGDLPTCLFPLGDRPMLAKIYNSYKDIVDEIYVVAYEKNEKIKTYINNSHLPIRLVCLDKLQDLGYTVKKGLEEILKYKNVEKVYINYADSLIEKIDVRDGNFAYCSKLDIDDQWTWISEDNGRITNILDKGNIENTDFGKKDFKHMLIGIYGISKPEIFLKLLERKSYNSEIDSLYLTLQEYSEKYRINFVFSEEWFDVGHSENYVKAQTKVAARAFNIIEIDDKRGTLTKKSNNTEKLINEIKWYLRLPNNLQYLIPRIYDYSLDFDNPYVKMEYYGYHTLHESLMYGDLSVSKWKNIFDKLLYVINDMNTYKINGRNKEIEKSLYNMYVDKVQERLEELRGKKEFWPFFNNKVVINGEEYCSLDDVINLLPRYVQKLLLKNASDYFSIIHGDLCFTNILVEDDYNFLRLIDPRGKFGPFDIYGDYRYELAKLFHTLEGCYDFIIEDMFDIQVDINKIMININMDCSNIFSIFKDVFENKISDLRAIRLIEATLFLSMIPLHSDYINRQYAMLATGIKLFNDVVKGEINSLWKK